MEILTYIGIFILGYWISHLIMVRRILRDPDRMIDLLKKYKEAAEEVNAENISPTTGNRIVEVEVLKENETFYLYSKDDNQFLGQGSTIESALDSIRKRYPNKVFKGFIPREQAEAWGLSDRI